MKGYNEGLRFTTYSTARLFAMFAVSSKDKITVWHSIPAHQFLPSVAIDFDWSSMVSN